MTNAQTETDRLRLIDADTHPDTDRHTDRKIDKDRQTDAGRQTRTLN